MNIFTKYAAYIMNSLFIWNQDGIPENFDGLNAIWNMNVYSKRGSRLDNDFLITLKWADGCIHWCL
jgi:hypothetical protein